MNLIIGVSLHINLPIFHDHKDEIESEVSEQLDWRELPDKKDSRVLIGRGVDLTNEAEWPEQFEWVSWQ